MAARHEGLNVQKARGGRLQHVRIALRMAWRDIRLHKGRTSLIITLVMLPVVGMTIATVLTASAVPTAQETVAAELGQTQAGLTATGAASAEYQQQSADPRNNLSAVRIEPDPQFEPTPPIEAAPAGYEILTETHSRIRVLKGDLPLGMHLVAVDALHPAFEGKFELVAGSAPTGNQVLLSEPAAERLGLKSGDTLKTKEASFEVAGLLQQQGYAGMREIVYVPPEHPLTMVPEGPSVPRGFAGSFSVYLVGDEPVTWDQVHELNALGVGVMSRSVMLDPPAGVKPSWLGYTNNDQFASALLGIVLIGLLALAEIALLAGAAFAVGAKNQRRELALLSASGAEASTVKGVVTASGVLLGGLAAVLGVLLGIGISAAAMPVLHQTLNAVFWGFHTVPAALVLIAVLGFLSAVIAAVIPARAVSKQNAFTAVRSAATASTTPKRTFLAGLAVLGLAAVVGGSGVVVRILSQDPDVLAERQLIMIGLIGASGLFLLIGLVLLSGKIIDIVARLARWLPLPMRMATRDASRNRSRSAPSVGAVLAATALATVLMVASNTALEESKEGHRWSLPEDHAMIELRVAETPVVHGITPPDFTLRDAGDVEQIVETVTGGPESSVLLRGVEGQCQKQKCVQYHLAIPEANQCPRTEAGNIIDPRDWRCQTNVSGMGAILPNLLVGDEDLLARMLGHEPSRNASEALANGKIVVLNQKLVHNGTAVLETVTTSAAAEPGTPHPKPQYEHTTVPAVAADPTLDLYAYAVMSPETAKQLGLPTTAHHLLLEFDNLPTQQQQDAIGQELQRQEPNGNNDIMIDRGLQSTLNIELTLWLFVAGAALLSLSAAGITAGLALADSRPDQATLASVGAPPSLRKSLAAHQTALTTILGGLLGAMTGIIPTLTGTLVLRNTDLAIPWLPLAVLLIATPLVGAATAWLFTRTKLPMARRQALQ